VAPRWNPKSRLPKPTRRQVRRTPEELGDEEVPDSWAKITEAEDEDEAENVGGDVLHGRWLVDQLTGLHFINRRTAIEIYDSSLIDCSAATTIVLALSLPIRSQAGRLRPW